MFKSIYHIFVPMTPAERAAVDIAQLERDLYEARLNYKKSREEAQNRQLRIDQIKTHIEELKDDYPETQPFAMQTPNGETAKSVIRSELWGKA